jgi:hypothetical protein
MIAAVTESEDHELERRGVRHAVIADRALSRDESSLVRQVIAKHPALALASAAALGLAIGWIVKRKL